MKKWTELVLAWFVGGFLGRLMAVGITNWLGLSAIWSWLGVPIGAGIAWMTVDFHQLVFSFRHSLKWTKPKFVESVQGAVIQCGRYLERDWQEFKPDGKWKSISCVSTGSLVSFWLIPPVLFWLYVNETGNRPPYITLFDKLCLLFVLLFFTGIVAFLLIGLGISFLEERKWDGFLVPRIRSELSELLATTSLGRKREAYKKTIIFLTFNPVSAILLSIFACLYCLPVWLGKAAWRTIQMVNSNQRITALTGAAIGLTISQIRSYNPLICGGVCVIAGLLERALFGLIVQAVSRRRGEKVVS